MGSSSSVQSSNPGSAEGSENVDFEAPEDIDDHETSTNSSDKVFVLAQQNSKLPHLSRDHYHLRLTWCQAKTAAIAT